jgi:hypothetical protein
MKDQIEDRSGPGNLDRLMRFAGECGFERYCDTALVAEFRYRGYWKPV